MKRPKMAFFTPKAFDPMLAQKIGPTFTQPLSSHEPLGYHEPKAMDKGSCEDKSMALGFTLYHTKALPKRS